MCETVLHHQKATKTDTFSSQGPQRPAGDQREFLKEQEIRLEDLLDFSRDGNRVVILFLSEIERVI